MCVITLGLYHCSKGADAVSVAAQATAQTIETVCSCAARQSGEDGNHVFWKTCEDSADSSEDDKENSDTKKSCCHRFRDNTKTLAEGTRFTRVIMASIFLNTVCMAVEHHGQVFLMNLTENLMTSVAILLSHAGHSYFFWLRENYED